MVRRSLGRGHSPRAPPERLSFSRRVSSAASPAQVPVSRSVPLAVLASNDNGGMETNPPVVETSTHPVVSLVPYLPLSAPVRFKGWQLGPLESFDGPWASVAFEDSVRMLAGVFRDAGGRPLARPSILTREATGADGVSLSREEFACLQAAIAFGVIHQNNYWSEETRFDGRRTATSDNAMLWVQPLDLDNHRITLERGSRVSLTGAGYRINDPDFTIPAPLELHLPPAVSLDAELLGAVYGVLCEPPEGRASEARAIAVAIRWLTKSWQNTPSITWEDRLVFVKVATEALTRKDRSHESAAEMVEIFRSALDQEGEGFGLDALLWRPDEPRLERKYESGGEERTSEVTQLEHWACALGDARNAVVHGGEIADHDYEERGSPYNGPFVEVGDRVVRELVTVSLGRLGHPRVWRDLVSRASLSALRELRDEAGPPRVD